MDGAQAVPLPEGAELVVLPGNGLPPGHGAGRPQPLGQAEGARALRPGDHQHLGRRRGLQRQGEEAQAVAHPQPVHPALQERTVAGLPGPGPLVPEGAAHGEAANPLPAAHPVPDPDPAGNPGRGQGGAALQAKRPPCLCPPLHLTGGGDQPGPAPDHGGQAQRKPQQGQAGGGEEEKVKEIAHIEELAHEGGGQGQEVEQPAAPHGYRILGESTPRRTWAAMSSAVPSAPGAGSRRWAQASRQMHCTSSGTT